MNKNGWEQNVEDGDGVRALHVDVPDVDEESALSCKERG